MSEWFTEPVLKTGDVERHRGFESLSLRQTASMAGLIPYQYHIRRSTQVAVRGSPAKGVGWGDWREGSNPSFSANGPEQNCAPGRVYSKEIAHRQGT